MMMLNDVEVILLKEQSLRFNERKSCAMFVKGTVIWILLKKQLCRFQ